MQKISPVYMFQLRAKGDQGGRGQANYPRYRSLILGDAENKNDLNPDAIASLASDGYDWGKFVVTCSAAKLR